MTQYVDDYWTNWYLNNPNYEFTTQQLEVGLATIPSGSATLSRYSPTYNPMVLSPYTSVEAIPERPLFVADDAQDPNIQFEESFWQKLINFFNQRNSEIWGDPANKEKADAALAPLGDNNIFKALGLDFGLGTMNITSILLLLLLLGDN